MIKPRNIKIHLVYHIHCYVKKINQVENKQTMNY